jgi:hypothetical protein
MEKNTTKPLLNSLLGEGTLSLNVNAYAKVGIDNESFMKLFATLAIVGIVLFAMYFMLSKLLA